MGVMEPESGIHPIDLNLKRDMHGEVFMAGSWRFDQS